MADRKKRKRYRKKSKIKIIKGEFLLTDHDQVTYIYKKEEEEYIEVTNVSYEIEFANKWVTIVRFDSSHGYLHQHVRLSLDDTHEIFGIEIKEGTHHEWLGISIADICTNFLEYRRQFFKRCGIIDTYS